MPKDNRGGRRAADGAEAVKAKMPELTGSEKQVKWAEGIRSSAATYADTIVKNAEKNVSLGIKPTGIDGSVPSIAAAKEARKMVVDNILTKVANAKQYIDGRNQLSYDNILKAANQIDRKKMR